MDVSEVINEEDNLNLSDINVVAVPNDILFPEELNQFLKGKVEFLMHTNGMLQKKLNENETELKNQKVQISQLTTKISEYENLTKTDQFPGTKTQLLSSKIVELHKKLKDKTVEVESLKTKNSKLRYELHQLENEQEEESEEKIEPILKEDEKTKFIEEIKQLQEKLAQANNKLFESRNINTQLKNELKAANKILQQEIGENFSSIQNISSNNTSWRGRAQQILNLQQKNTELQEKLSIFTLKESVPPLPKVDTRKQIIEQQKEISVLKSELDDTKKKLNGSRARVKVLENECNGLRLKMNTICTKTENDEKLISVLKNQIVSMEQSNNAYKKEKNSGTQKLENENKNLKHEASKYKTIVDDLTKIVKEKDATIVDLQAQVKCWRPNSVENKSASDTKSPRDLSKLKIMEVEVGRLLELIQILNNRLNSERDAFANMQINYKKERQRAAKLEVKLSRLELENNINKSQNYSKSFNKLASEEPSNIVTVENMKNNLELAEESVNILKTKLDIIQKEKDLDIQRFSNILSETSSMLLKYNISSSRSENTV